MRTRTLSTTQLAQELQIPVEEAFRILQSIEPSLASLDDGKIASKGNDDSSSSSNSSCSTLNATSTSSLPLTARDLNNLLSEERFIVTFCQVSSIKAFADLFAHLCMNTHTHFSLSLSLSLSLRRSMRCWAVASRSARSLKSSEHQA